MIDKEPTKEEAKQILDFLNSDEVIKYPDGSCMFGGWDKEKNLPIGYIYDKEHYNKLVAKLENIANS